MARTHNRYVMKIKSRKALQARAAGCSAVLMVAAFGHADVKIVSHMHGMAMGRALQEQTQTTYYKGDKTRTDQFGTTILFDAKTGKVDILRTADKTYFEVSADDMPPFMNGTKMDATAKVTQTDEHKTIAGLKATKSNINIHLTLTNGGAAPKPIDMSVDLWTTSDLKTPYAKQNLLRSLGQFLRGMSFTGASQLVTELGKVNGFPIAQTVSLTTIPGLPDAPAGAASGPMVTVDVTPESVTEAPLADDLFTIPADFKKVDRPGPGGG